MKLAKYVPAASIALLLMAFTFPVIDDGDDDVVAARPACPTVGSGENCLPNEECADRGGECVVVTPTPLKCKCNI